MPTIQDVLKQQMQAPAGGVQDPTAGGYRGVLADFAAKRKAAALASPSAATLGNVLAESYGKMGSDAMGRFNVGVGWQAQPANRNYAFGAAQDSLKGVRGDQEGELMRARMAEASARAAGERERILQQMRGDTQAHGYEMQKLGLKQDRADMESRISRDKSLDTVLAKLLGGVGETYVKWQGNRADPWGSWW